MERLDQGITTTGETNRYHYQPRGIVVVIFWNFPAIATGMTVAALVSAIVPYSSQLRHLV